MFHLQKHSAINFNSRRFIIVRFNSILLSGDTSLSRNRLLSRNEYFGKIGLDNIQRLKIYDCFSLTSVIWSVRDRACDDRTRHDCDIIANLTLSTHAQNEYTNPVFTFKISLPFYSMTVIYLTKSPERRKILYRSNLKVLRRVY